eukprot:TRINITY_DN73881_c0_g1_i1.p1 TRINITY_DN73881_c0_g1~~TRINITY_DN73881_c0_g1_i1.p1  ORF type:complete len:223 (-),score=37.53 TRINITY_DN73881_c0_g1_i1:119-787(-)
MAQLLRRGRIAYAGLRHRVIQPHWQKVHEIHPGKFPESDEFLEGAKTAYRLTQQAFVRSPVVSLSHLEDLFSPSMWTSFREMGAQFEPARQQFGDDARLDIHGDVHAFLHVAHFPPCMYHEEAVGNVKTGLAVGDGLKIGDLPAGLERQLAADHDRERNERGANKEVEVSNSTSVIAAVRFFAECSFAYAPDESLSKRDDILFFESKWEDGQDLAWRISWLE